ncbi:hypothetical protein B0F90DRAFT_68321 [Multifurca ochricompacta]|uniref:Elongator complex protein 5 n=1 Tax=Multifurca ochricompacta TaxID=376703 RepID=A0AAD4MCH2_9AGAM|nr:hypothetical protein B0F90DRAFT_68321 [Multifurca ochricompacta]
MILHVPTHCLLVSEPSGLVVHFSGTSPLCDLILTPRLSPNLVHIIAHPPGLLQHLATTQLIPPPPASAPDLFWRVFTPLTGRRWEVEGILLGSGGQGPTEDESIVLEIVNRTLNRKTIKIDKFLEAWNRDLPCSLSQLDILKPFLLQKLSSSSSSSFTFNTFNLNLTPEQWISRAKVPLPYAHKGSSSGSGAIMYEPDSADDIDDDDPDEDLNI